MIKKWAVILIALLLATIVLGAAAEEAQEQDEWTVLFYLCGSDLESRFHYASGNLEEIASCQEPVNTLSQLVDAEDPVLGEAFTAQPGKINVVIETGGAKSWHAQALNLEIATDRLQRWVYHPHGAEEKQGTFELLGEAPLQSMADPETLTDFIRWGAERFPAKKYALVLWDHGGGSKTGIFIDELFEGDVMYLDELRNALGDSGVHFELTLFDACLMANLETAYAIKEMSNWMVASEEVVAGKGSAIGNWLQQLYYLSNCDGKLLGRWICDMTLKKYDTENNEAAREVVTWSVIDLSKIDRVGEQFNTLLELICYAYDKYPELVSRYARSIFRTEQFGTGQENMWDIMGIFYRELFNASVDKDHRKEMMEALADAVVYTVRGNGRNGARGLSFCYALDFYPEEMTLYARNCPNPNYLALLDAISPWSAPEWVYDYTERLPEMNELAAYQVSVDRKIHTDGTPAFSVPDEQLVNVGSVFYQLFRYNEETGQTISLGYDPAYYDKKEKTYRVYDLWLWPAIDDVLCQVNIVGVPKEGGYDCALNIPILIDGNNWNLRCNYITSRDAYEVEGLWEGTDTTSEMFNRNIKSLPQMAGREYRLMYEVMGSKKKGEKIYETSGPMTMYRGLSVEERVLPPGKYILQYVIYDNFMRCDMLENVEIHWDGKNMSVNEEDWKGTSTLDFFSYYNAEKYPEMTPF